MSLTLGAIGACSVIQNIRLRRENRALKAKCDWATSELDKKKNNICSKSREEGLNEGFVLGYRQASADGLGRAGLVNPLTLEDCDKLKSAAQKILGDDRSDEYDSGVMDGALQFARYINDEN